MGVIPFPEPEPESNPDLITNLFGDFFAGIFGAFAGVIPDGMTVGDLLEEVAKIPLTDVLAALNLLPPTEDAS